MIISAYLHDMTAKTHEVQLIGKSPTERFLPSIFPPQSFTPNYFLIIMCVLIWMQKRVILNIVIKPGGQWRKNIVWRTLGETPSSCRILSTPRQQDIHSNPTCRVWGTCESFFQRLAAEWVEGSWACSFPLFFGGSFRLLVLCASCTIGCSGRWHSYKVLP